MIFFRGAAYYQPEIRMSSSDISNWIDSPAEFLENKVGIVSRAFASPEQATSDLGKAAIEALCRKHPDLNLERVGLMIVVTQNPDYQLPHTAAILQAALDIPHRCACFDVSLGCSGFVYSLSIAKGFMATEDIDDAIIVTADPYSKVMDRHDRNTVAVFGDAAAAAWLSRSKGGGSIGRGNFGTDGTGANDLIVRTGGAREPLGGLWRDRTPSDDARSAAKPQLYMNGRAIFDFMMERVPASISEALERNDLTIDDVDYFVLHQASRYLLETLCHYMNLDREKVIIDIEETGNTVSSTIPIILSKLAARDGGLLDKVVLVSGFGVGLSWASNVLRFSTRC